jgi:hypothetical protein
MKISAQISLLRLFAIFRKLFWEKRGKITKNLHPHFKKNLYPHKYRFTKFLQLAVNFFGKKEAKLQKI